MADITQPPDPSPAGEPVRPEGIVLPGEAAGEPIVPQTLHYAAFTKPVPMALKVLMGVLGVIFILLGGMIFCFGGLVLVTIIPGMAGRDLVMNLMGIFAALLLGGVMLFHGIRWAFGRKDSPG